MAEIKDPHSGIVLHRPPGGGVEEGESPEDAVRREIREEPGIALTDVKALGAIGHTWFWKGREVSERAWIFGASTSDDARLMRGGTPDIVEADGTRVRTMWRPIYVRKEELPPLCPSRLSDLL